MGSRQAQGIVHSSSVDNGLPRFESWSSHSKYHPQPKEPAVNEKQFKRVETSVKWTVIASLWALVSLAVLGLISLADLVF